MNEPLLTPIDIIFMFIFWPAALLRILLRCTVKNDEDELYEDE